MLRNFGQIVIRVPFYDSEAYNNVPDPLPASFEEGIYWASPQLYAALLKSREITTQEDKKLKESITKYWLRSCTRATPFGVFAGIALLELKPEPTAIKLSCPQNHLKKIRVDITFINELVQHLQSIPEILPILKFRLNDSLYSLPGVVRYIEYLDKGDTREFKLSSIAKSALLNSIFRFMKPGRTLKQLTEYLNIHTDANQNEVNNYINELIRARLLICELEPRMTDTDPLDSLLVKLKEHDSNQQINTLISNLTGVSIALKKNENTIPDYHNIEKQLSTLVNSPFRRKSLLHADLFLKLVSNTMNRQLIEEITSQIDDLCCLTQKNRNNFLEIFKNKFSQSYQDQYVPLMTALDMDYGVGYSQFNFDSYSEEDLISDLNSTSFDGYTQTDYSAIRDFCINKYRQYLDNGLDEIKIEHSELEGLERGQNVYIPSSMCIFGSLLKSEDEINKEKFSFALKNISGPSGANLLGRFAYGDRKIMGLVNDIISKEEAIDGDSIYAEIIHTPATGVGNSLIRPNLRKYSIQYLGGQGPDTKNQITVDDIVVTVRNDRVLLYSQSLKKRLIPRLTTAHNFNNKPLTVYKFLCDVQYQDRELMAVWDWGDLEKLTYLPSVVYKNIILKRARWKITAKHLSGLPEDHNRHSTFLEKFRLKYKMPSKLLLIEYEDELLIDLKTTAGVALFLKSLSGKKEIILEEFIYHSNKSIISDPNNKHYISDLLIPVYTEQQQIIQTGAKAPLISNKIKRMFPPHSEWLYLKIYGGALNLERLLTDFVYPFITKNKLLFQHFFFVRYKDEFDHLRIRFFNTHRETQGKLYQFFMNGLDLWIKKKIVSRVIVDSYEREIERYGFEKIIEVEHFFYKDSIAVLKLLKLINKGFMPKTIAALYSIDQLFTDFGFSLKERHFLVDRLRVAFFQEFGGSKMLLKQLNSKYRLMQEAINNYLENKKTTDQEKRQLNEIIKIRSADTRWDINEITHLKKTKETDFNDLISSLIHMHINRLFCFSHRKHELLLYHLLERHYYSKLIRASVIVQ
ncbi:lantibiotic dehydratase [Mucilaginibacter sp. KACC 22773]|uniref:lantibiotic dehydratase n=1 Tax=Mucilaginibacter sp. KACC 22773 TaxID=3025671 RepID=UPI002365B30D|nr:lantibiotic dehydratase [Mucilaginibacter sp. KACC 22773]WDF77695.1 lantibiotic dehydratase [Mucilaginibacter sp. KACC 22773]